MKSEKVKIQYRIGLHARPAALFVQTAGKFLSDITIEKEDRIVNAKSIMGIMALGVAQGEEVEIVARGEDEKEAIEALVELLNQKSDEE